jgi:hypothetical protein
MEALNLRLMLTDDRVHLLPLLTLALLFEHVARDIPLPQLLPVFLRSFLVDTEERPIDQVQFRGSRQLLATFECNPYDADNLRAAP